MNAGRWLDAIANMQILTQGRRGAEIKRFSLRFKRSGGVSALKYLALLITLYAISACNVLDIPPTPTLTPFPSPTRVIASVGRPATATPRFFSTNTPSVSEATAIPPTPTPVCGELAPRTRMIVGERGIVLEEDERAVNIREGANTNFDIVGQIEPGEVFYVIEGPVCSERYAWYHIEYGDLDGWIAEGDHTAYFVAPYLPG